MTNRVIVAIVALAASACSASASPGATVPRQFQESSPQASTPASKSEPSLVAVSKDIREACGLSETRAFFAYNASRVTAEDRELFQKLASCFATGPLKGHAMRVVGHADPRGDTDYNYLLGQRRADNVRAAVVGAGLTEAQISATSRGELEAEGHDESGWSRDRRVDVVLGESS